MGMTPLLCNESKRRSFGTRAIGHVLAVALCAVAQSGQAQTLPDFTEIYSLSALT